MAIDHVVDIAENGQHLLLCRGYLLVNCDHHAIEGVPLEEISALIVHGHGKTLPTNLISALANLPYLKPRTIVHRPE